MDEIKVTVICLTYNHQDYIRKALDGFVMQRTNFAYEVLIHDDASNDGTTDIIKEYEMLYPELFRPVYQTENQYSKGIPITRSILLPLARGQYLAFCEGDDYWIDPYKLQKQYDFMTNNPDYSLCVHQAIRHNCQSNEDMPMTRETRSREYSVEEVITSGGSLFATNTCFMKREVSENRPQCFYAKGFSDYQMFMYGAISGGCYYLADTMSVYNCGTVGSWTQRVERNKDKRIVHYREMINMLQRVDAYYDLYYTNAIQDKIRETEYRLFKTQGKLFKMYKPKYKKYMDAEKRRGMFPVKECIAARVPGLVTLKRKIVTYEK